MARDDMVPPPLPGAPKTCGLAKASLVLGLLTPFCLVTAIPGFICGFMALRRIDASNGTLKGRGLAVGGLAVNGAVPIFIVIFGLLAAILFPALGRAREAARRAECQGNLKQFGMVVELYAQGNAEKRYPPLDPSGENLMFDAAKVFPEPAQTTKFLECPSDAEYFEGVRDTPEGINDWSYVYLGYAIMNDDEMAAFVEVYRARVAAGQGFEEDLPAPPGRGSFGGDVFLRLGENVRRAAAEKGIDPATIPVAWDQAGYFEGILMYNHMPGGSNVLYFDGHVEFVRFSCEDEQWPMTSAMLETMAEFSPLGDG